MTKQEQFQAALARAAADGCYIIGSGTVRAGEHAGRRCWSVSGKSGHPYLVVQVADRQLQCSCKSRVFCKHEALAFTRIQEESTAAVAKVEQDRRYFRDLQWSEMWAGR